MNFEPRKCTVAAMMMMSLTGGTAGAEPAKFEEQIRYRQAVMVMMKWHSEKLASLLKNPPAFNRGEALNSAVILEMLSKVAMEGFVPGSYTGETKAKLAIEKDWGRFKTIGDKFAMETAKLRERTQSGDVAAVKAQLRETRNACKECHDDFKSSSLF